MLEKILNDIGKEMVVLVKEEILTPRPRFTKIGEMPKKGSPYNFSSNQKSGNLYNSVDYEVVDDEIYLLMADYGVDYVFGDGSKPGKKFISKFIIETKLEPWVRTKLKKVPPESKSIAYAIATKLTKVGYAGYKIFQDEFQKKVSDYVEVLLERPEYQDEALRAELGDVFNRINLLGQETFNIAIKI
jgi:hypothetical protein